VPASRLDANRWTLGRAAVAAGFFIYFFLFVWRQVDPELFYHGDMVVLGPERHVSFPVFQTGTDFFLEHARQPGGVATYLASLLAQFCYYPAGGAAVLTLVAMTLFHGTLVVGRVLSLDGHAATAYVAPLAILGILCSFVLPLSAIVSIVIALYGVAGFAVSARLVRGFWPRAAIYGAWCVPLCWCLGGGVLVFAVAVSLIEHNLRTPLLPWVCPSAGCGILLLAIYVRMMTQPDRGFHFTWERLASESLRAAVPSAVYLIQVVLMAVWSLVVRRRRQRLNASSSLASGRDRLFRGLVSVALLCGAAVLVSFGLLNYEARGVLRANCLARKEMWAELLREVRQNPPAAYPPGLLVDINRALHECGRLGDEMFLFPQNPAFLIQTADKAVPHRGCHSLLLAMGCLNEAEHTIYEALEVLGSRPYILRDLAVINIVKQRPEAARVFLRLLSRDVIRGGWANECLTRLDADSALESDPLVTHIRRFAIAENRIAVPDHELPELAFQQNANNRMAFDYMMAYYLLTFQTDKVLENVRRLRDLGYERIPEHYAEAILLNWHVTGQEPDLDDWQLDASTTDRFAAFLELTRKPDRDPQAIARIVSGSYYEYYFAHRAPSS